MLGVCSAATEITWTTAEPSESCLVNALPIHLSVGYIAINCCVKAMKYWISFHCQRTSGINLQLRSIFFFNCDSKKPQISKINLEFKLPFDWQPKLFISSISVIKKIKFLTPPPNNFVKKIQFLPPPWGTGRVGNRCNDIVQVVGPLPTSSRNLFTYIF